MDYYQRRQKVAGEVKNWLERREKKNEETFRMFSARMAIKYGVNDKFVKNILSQVGFSVDNSDLLIPIEKSQEAAHG